jgi:S-adenosylmethionine decarboxylase
LFGPHLILDGSKCDTAKLADRHAIERILTDYPRAIGMTRIGGPYMFEYQAPDPAYSGVSGLVVIAESHIAIHTFPALDYFSMDIFSCKNFDHEKAIAYIREALDVREMDRMLIQRGLSFRGPHHGPLGATDEMIAATAARNQSLGVTIGSLPPDDPLAVGVSGIALTPTAPRGTGRMIWPTYGQMPDIGTYGPAAATDVSTRNGTGKRSPRRTPANAAAAGDRAPAGLTPVQPVALNPTASISGMLDQMTTLTGLGKALGEALAHWEALARDPRAPIVLALGPQVVAQGMRDIVADLIHRGHVSALIIEGATLLADAYESLGHRHYLPANGSDAFPRPDAAEWAAARAKLVAMLDLPDGPVASREVAARLGTVLHARAPRPGIVSTAAERHVPLFVVGEDALTELGITAIAAAADITALGELLASGDAGVIAFDTTERLAAFIGAAGTPAEVIAIGAPALLSADSASVVCPVDATVALPLLAIGLAQRLPERPHRATPAPELVVVS